MVEDFLVVCKTRLWRQCPSNCQRTLQPQRCWRGFFCMREWYCEMYLPVFCLLWLHLWMWLFIGQGRHNRGRNVVQYDNRSPFIAAYGKAAAISNAQSWLRATDIWPFKADVFEDFLLRLAETFNKTTQNPNEDYPCKPRPRERLSALVLHRLKLNEVNLLKPSGYVMHQQFNIQQLYALPTLYLCVLYLSENKQRLVPLTA